MLGLSLSLPSRRSPSGGGGGSPPVNDTPPVIAGETRASCQISCPGQVESSIDTFGFDIDSADGVKTVRINDTADVTVTIGPDVSDADVAEAVKVAMEAAFPELWTIERFLNSLTITDTSLGDRTAPVEAPALQFIVNSFTQTQEFPVGSTLTRTEGTWSDADSVAGNWQHDQGTGTWVNISGETGATYDIQAIYAGEDIRYNETATNGAGSTSEPSNELGPVTAWWVAGGASGVVAAYQAKGAASFAASKVNIANPGTFDAANGEVVPSFDSATGWIFSGSDWLETGIEPGANWTMLIQVSDIGNGRQVLLGCQTAGEAERFRVFADFSDQCFYGNGGQTGFSPGFTTPGNVGFAGVNAYRNGVFDGSIVGIGYAGSGLDVWVGGSNEDGSFVQGSAFRCSSLVIYNNQLDAGKVAAVAAAMAAL